MGQSITAFNSAGDVRLVGDQRDTVGAVELYHPMTGWTGICADANYIHMWRDNRRAAETVCAQLGYLGGTPYVQRSVSCTRLPPGSCLCYDVGFDFPHQMI